MNFEKFEFFSGVIQFSQLHFHLITKKWFHHFRLTTISFRLVPDNYFDAQFQNIVNNNGEHTTSVKCCYNTSTHLTQKSIISAESKQIKLPNESRATDGELRILASERPVPGNCKREHQRKTIEVVGGGEAFLH